MKYCSNVLCSVCFTLCSWPSNMQVICILRLCLHLQSKSVYKNIYLSYSREKCNSILAKNVHNDVVFRQKMLRYHRRLLSHMKCKAGNIFSTVIWGWSSVQNVSGIIYRHKCGSLEAQSSVWSQHQLKKDARTRNISESTSTQAHGWHTSNTAQAL